ncbi:glycosyltransferase family 39 protein [Patescibacteria group bacterium]
MSRVKFKQIFQKFITPQSFFLTFFIALGGFLRFFNITKNGLWYDETFSAVMIRNPLTEIIQKGIYDVHPPFYYFILKIWTIIFGEGELALKGFSAFLGTLLIIAVYVLVKNLFNRRVALISSFLITVAPFFIQYSQETRMYMLGAVLATISTFYLWKALHNQEKKLNLYYWASYAIFTLLGLYTHYFLIFTVAAQVIGTILGIFSLPQKDRKNILKKWWQFGLSLLSVAILYLPWLPILFKQFNQVSNDFWIPIVSTISVLRTFFVITVGSIEIENLTLLSIPLVIIIIISIILSKIYREKSLQKSALTFNLSYLFVPVILGIIISIKQSIFLDRYFIFSGVAIFILFGLLISKIKNNKILIGGMIITAILSIILVSTSIFGYDAPKEGVRELSLKLNEKYKPDEKIIHSSSFTFIPLKYYNEDKEGVITTDEIHHYSGDALIEGSDVMTDIEEYIERDNHFWIIDTSDFGDPDLPQIPPQFTQKETYQFGRENLIYYERK